MDLREALSGKSYAPLTIERDFELRVILQADPTSAQRRAVRDELIKRHLRMVLHIGRGYRHRLSEEDILAVGSLALTQAAERWQPEKGPFYGWARRWVTTALTKSVDAGRIIRVPEAVANSAALAARDVQAAEMEAGRRLTAAERREVEGGRWTFDRMPSTSSLDQPAIVEDGQSAGATAGDRISCGGPTPEEMVLTLEKREKVNCALNGLDEIETVVIRSRFGFEGSERRTLSELGAIYGVSPEGMRRIETSAIAKLRHPASKNRLDGLL